MFDKLRSKESIEKRAVAKEEKKVKKEIKKEEKKEKKA